MADHVLAVLRRVMTWYAARNDEYRSPIVRGMSRTSPKDRARERTLTDDEIRALWKTADELATPFARMMQFLLLTGVRRNEAARMNRNEINGSAWLIPNERFKGKRDFLVPLTAAATDILKTLPAIGKGGWIFTSDGKRPINGFGKSKARFDKLMVTKLRQAAAERGEDVGALKLENWTIHDLRRTTRTLLSRCKVQPDIAERCLGHAIVGVRGVYDRHEFLAEKRAALEVLAALVARIINPPAGNVVTLRKEVSGMAIP